MIGIKFGRLGATTIAASMVASCTHYVDDVQGCRTESMIHEARNAADREIENADRYTIYPASVIEGRTQWVVRFLSPAPTEDGQVTAFFDKQSCRYQSVSIEGRHDDYEGIPRN